LPAGIFLPRSSVTFLVGTLPVGTSRDLMTEYGIFLNDCLQ